MWYSFGFHQPHGKLDLIYRTVFQYVPYWIQYVTKIILFYYLPGPGTRVPLWVHSQVAGDMEIPHTTMGGLKKDQPPKQKGGWMGCVQNIESVTLTWILWMIYITLCGPRPEPFCILFIIS